MMLLLILDVRDHPGQVFRSEANDSIPGLPLKHFVARDGLAIHVVRGTALQLANPFARRECRRHRHGKVYVRGDATNLMNVRTGSFDDSLTQRTISSSPHFVAEQGKAVLGVPNQVQIDLAVLNAGHDDGARGP